MGLEQFRYDSKRALVLGAATGMGAAAARLAAELGAQVTALDVAAIDYPAAQSVRVDLRSQANVDAAIAELGGRFDVLFCCAGVADGAPGLMAVNFIGQRYFMEQLLAKGALNAGAAVVMIASVAGLPWLRKLDLVLEFLQTPDWDAPWRGWKPIRARTTTCSASRPCAATWPAKPSGCSSRACASTR